MTAASNPGPIPESYRRVTPCLVVRDAAKALEFYAEVFGAAFAASWALATLFDLGGLGARVLDVMFVVGGVLIMAQFIRNAHRIEPFTARS